VLSGYYAKMQKTGCVPTHKSESPVTAASQSHHSPKNHISWSDNPLIWTAIVSLSIAIVATVLIVLLVVYVQVRQRRTTGKQRLPGVRQQSTSSSSYSAVENGTGTVLTPSNLPAQIYLPPNGLKEKSGKPALDLNE